MNALETLKAARKLIEKEENWCTGFLAKLEDGTPIHPNAQGNPVQYCSLGAIIRVNPGAYHTSELNRAARKLGYTELVELNNTAGHAKTLEMFDLAICMKECEDAKVSA